MTVAQSITLESTLEISSNYCHLIEWRASHQLPSCRPVIRSFARSLVDSFKCVDATDCQAQSNTSLTVSLVCSFHYYLSSPSSANFMHSQRPIDCVKWLTQSHFASCFFVAVVAAVVETDSFHLNVVGLFTLVFRARKNCRNGSHHIVVVVVSLQTKGKYMNLNWICISGEHLWLMAFRFSHLCHRLRRVHGHGYHGMGLHTQTRIIDRQRQQNHYYNHSIEQCAAPRRLRQFECRTPDPKLITLSQDPVHQRNELILRFLRVFFVALAHSVVSIAYSHPPDVIWRGMPCRGFA